MTISVKRIEKTRTVSASGLETIVDRVGIVMVVLGSVLAILFLVSVTWWGLLACLITITAVLTGYLALRCLSEQLRLLKKIAGIPFDGAISGGRDEQFLACGRCGQMLHSETRCDACGAVIEVGPE